MAVAKILTLEVLNLGKRGRKRIKEFRNHRTGSLHLAVSAAIDAKINSLGDEVDGATVLPIVIIVEKKRRKRSWPFDLVRY